MSDGFVQKLGGTGTTSVTVTLSGVAAASALGAFLGDGTNSAPTTHTVSDGQGSYTGGTSAADATNNVFIQPFTLQNANSGSHAVVGTVDTGQSVFLEVFECTGPTTGAVLGTNSAFQSAPAAGADTLNSGNVTVSQAATAIGFAVDTSSVATSDEPTTGTSPISFTSRDNNANTVIGAWLLESAAVSSTGAATAGPVTNAHNFITSLIVIANAGGGGAAVVPYVPVVQVFSGAPSSVAPYLRRASVFPVPANTGVYIGPQRSQYVPPQPWPYTVAADYAIPYGVGRFGITAIYLGPQKSQYVPPQPGSYVRITTSGPAVFPAPASYVSPSAPAVLLAQSWPYAMVADLEILDSGMPSQFGITPVYLAPTPPLILPPQPWPYARITNSGPAVFPAPASYVPILGTNVPNSQQWPYLVAIQQTLARPGLEFGIPVADLIFDRLKPDIVAPQAWPYELVAVFQLTNGVATMAPPPPYIPPAEPANPVPPQAWPYTFAATFELPVGPATFPVPASYVSPSAPLMPVQQTWPYAALAQPVQTIASQFGITPMFVFPAGPTNPVPQPQPWPYAKAAMMPTFYLVIPPPAPGTNVIEWLMMYRRRGRR